MTGYATTATTYANLGWHPLPIPNGKKASPPTGSTGGDGCDPGPDDIEAWALTQPDANIAIRLPNTVLGIDVDHYDTKRGADTLTALEADHGPLPPTWSSTSRGPDQPSRISFYRIPAGTRFPGALGRDIEAIQRHHRYAVVNPSTRDDTGGTYHWYQPDGQVARRPPHHDELAELPTRWITALAIQPTSPQPATSRRQPLGDDSIAQHVNDAHHWHDLLNQDGWQLQRHQGPDSHWTRPGKDPRHGTSGVLHGPDGPFVVFTTSVAELQQHWAATKDRSGWAYSKFGYIAATRHQGDRSECARQARQHINTPTPTARDIDNADGPEPVDVDDVDEQPYTILGNARRLVNEHGHDLHHVPQWGAWLTWDNTRWTEDHTGEADRRAKHIVDNFPTQLATIDSSERRRKLFTWWMKSQTPAVLNGMLTLAATEPGIPVLVDQLDADPWTLNTTSGAINLHTSTLHTAARTQLCTKLAPTRHHPDATCPNWTRFLHWAMQDNTDLVNFLQRAIGYTITGTVSEQVLFFLHGQGSNGKSTFLAVLQRLLGDYAFSAEADLLLAVGHERHSTGIADLHGRRMVIVQEIDEGRRLDEALVKRLTGGDRLTARRMRQDNFEFQPSHKLWMAANHKPVVRGTDHAIWRRIRLIPFLATIPDTDKDPGLVDKLWAEAPGILNWALEGCRKWQTEGLAAPAGVTQATHAYRSEQDHIGRFLDECCTLGEGLRIPTKELRNAYERWCFETGEKAWSVQAMASQLQDRGCVQDRAKDAGRARQWVGLALTGEAEEEMRRRLDFADWGKRASGERYEPSESSSNSVRPVDNSGHWTNLVNSSVTPHAHAREREEPEHSSSPSTSSTTGIEDPFT